MPTSTNLPSKRRPLAVILSAAAAAALLVVVPAREGTVYKTYRDIAGIYTYCTGATENAIWGKTYTPAECRAQLESDLAKHAEGVMACVHVPLTDGQMVAFTDLAYNVGVANFCGSSVARKTNAGDKRGGCDAILMWDKARVNGQLVVVRGLQLRRQADREYCLKEGAL